MVPYLLQTDSKSSRVPLEILDGFEEKLQADCPDFLAAFGKQFLEVPFLNNPVSQPILD